MKCIFFGKYMADKDSNGLGYISDVFKGLPSEEKDYVLGIARSLLEIQEDNTYPKSKKASSPKMKDSGQN